MEAPSRTFVVFSWMQSSGTNSCIPFSDSTGNVTDGYAYDSFGVLANQDGDSPQPFRYLGQHGIMEDSSGLYYARARHFSPQLGRFLTKDPLTGRDSDGQSLNRFVYALNRPLSFLDASGLSAQEFSGLSQYLSFSDFATELSFLALEKGGQYLFDLQLGDKGLVLFDELARKGYSVDFRGVGFVAKRVGQSFQIYSIASRTMEELASRGITVEMFFDSWRNIGANIEYGIQNRDASLDALTEGVTSATAFYFNTISLGLLDIHGEDLERVFAY